MQIETIKYTDDTQTLVRVTTTTGEVVVVDWPSTDWYARFVQEWIDDGNTIADAFTAAENLQIAKSTKNEEVRAEGLRRVQEILPIITDEGEIDAWKKITAGSLQSLPSTWQVAADIYQTARDSIITINGLSNVNTINNIDVVNDIAWPVGSPALQ